MPEEKKGKKAAAAAPKDKDSNLLAALGYLVNLVFLPWSFVIYFVKKEDSFVRFHSLQAGLLWVAALVVGLVLGVLTGVVAFVFPPLACVTGLLQLVVGLAFLGVDLYAAWMAYEGTRWEIPVVGEFTSKHL